MGRIPRWNGCLARLRRPTRDLALSQRVCGMRAPRVAHRERGVVGDGRKRISWNPTKCGGECSTVEVSGIWTMRPQWRAVWKVKCEGLEDETRPHAKSGACWGLYGETAAVAHTCTHHLFPRSRMSCRVGYRRISDGVK